VVGSFPLEFTVFWHHTTYGQMVQARRYKAWKKLGLGLLSHFRWGGFNPESSSVTLLDHYAQCGSGRLNGFSVEMMGVKGNFGSRNIWPSRNLPLDLPCFCAKFGNSTHQQTLPPCPGWKCRYQGYMCTTSNKALVDFQQLLNKNHILFRRKVLTELFKADDNNERWTRVSISKIQRTVN